MSGPPGRGRAWRATARPLSDADRQVERAREEIRRARSKPDALTEAERPRSAALLARVPGNAPEERVQLQKLIGLEPTNEGRRLQVRRNLHLGYDDSWSSEPERARKEFSAILGAASVRRRAMARTMSPPAGHQTA